MATMKTRSEYLTRLKKSLVDDLKAANIQAKVSTEPVPTTLLHRVTVIAAKFKALKHSERQSLVWRIAERTLSEDEQLRISMILTLTRAEADGK